MEDPETRILFLTEDGSRLTCRVRLMDFEGPLDLLLYLVKKEEMDICDIPIAKLTEQYIQYLEVMREFDLEVSCEFLVMAATLLHIKSRMLLPIPEPEEEEEEDPRAELSRRLLEYKRIKEAAELLQSMALREENVFYRSAPLSKEVLEFEDEDGELILEVSLYDLIKAYRRIVRREARKRRAGLEIVRPKISVEQMISEIMEILSQEIAMDFTNAFKGRRKLEILVAFIAILELARIQRISVDQEKPFERIIVQLKESEPIP
ncbi:MAG: segregation and condensation protein A [bacterium]